MSEERQGKSTPLLRFAAFFELALDKIGPPWMKLVLALFVVLLLALVVTRGSTSPNLAVAVFGFLVLVFGFLLWLLEYVKLRLDYQVRTGELLKNELRDRVQRLLELEKVGRDNPRT